MENKYSISINSLSKTYKLYETKYDFVKEVFNPIRKSYHVNFHALKDISFAVKTGEVLGIIGKNGSGKSTLLKILASVVTPTSGSFNCLGRVTALLELSGGFNRDLSGIENVKFLSALQGFSKNDIGKIIAQVLEFAEIGDYAFQPIKTYSSGMYMRLAFSLAISVEPDILIVDEVLAVGDVRFKQKCLKKIAEFKERGKTIVICTHSLGTLKEFCTQAIWLHDGEVKEIGLPIEVAKNYSTFMTSQQANLPQQKRFQKKVYI